MRQTADMLYFPSLVESVIALLENEMSAQKDKFGEVALILKDLTHQMRNNAPNEPLQPKDTSTYKAQSRMSLDRLLN